MSEIIDASTKFAKARLEALGTKLCEKRGVDPEAEVLRYGIIDEDGSIKEVSVLAKEAAADELKIFIEYYEVLFGSAGITN